MKIFAMIPARSGSKGLADKNVALAGGHPLIGHAMAFASKLPVDRIVVSSDSSAYLEVAQRYYDPLRTEVEEVYHRRGSYASSDTAMEEDVVADYLVGWGNEPPDVWVWIKPTSPFRRVADVEQGLTVLRDRPAVDSVRVVTRADARLQKTNELGMLEWYGEPARLGRSKMRRTEVTQVFKPFNLEIFRHEKFRQVPRLFMGVNIWPIVAPAITGIDVDGQEDLDLVDAIMRADPRPAWLEGLVHA